MSNMKDFIVSLLKKACLTSDIIKLIFETSKLKESNYEQFKTALTHSSTSIYNYEILEHFGDAILKSVTVTYIDERWPTLELKVRSPLSQKLYSKEQLSSIATQLGFKQYISSNVGINDSILEDVFEAFLGALTRVLDSICGRGAGYCAVYNLMSSIWDEQKISVDEEKVINMKTQLKEKVFDALGWKTNLMLSAKATIRFKDLFSLLVIYYDEDNQRWNDKNIDNKFTPYYINEIYNPEGILLSFYSSGVDSDSKVEASKIAYEIFKETDVISYIESKESNSESPSMVTTRELPLKYQSLVRALTNKNWTHDRMHIKKGLIEIIKRNVKNPSQTYSSVEYTKN